MVPKTIALPDCATPRPGRQVGACQEEGGLVGPVCWSGRRDSNPRPLVPQTSALTRLRHAPKRGDGRRVGRSTLLGRRACAAFRRGGVRPAGRRNVLVPLAPVGGALLGDRCPSCWTGEENRTRPVLGVCHPRPARVGNRRRRQALEGVLRQVGPEARVIRPKPLAVLMMSRACRGSRPLCVGGAPNQGNMLGGQAA